MRTASLVVLVSCSTLPREPGPADRAEPSSAVPAATDALVDVPELVGARLRQDLSITLAPGASCDGPAARMAVARGDVPVLRWSGRPGTWRTTDPAASGPTDSGEARLPAGMPAGVHRACVETPDGVAAVDLEVTSAPYTQISLHELNPDRSERWRSIMSQEVSRTTVSRRWISSDFSHSQGVWDERGRVLSVAVGHEGDDYTYDATLAEPVPAGGVVVLDQRGLAEPSSITDEGDGVFAYAFEHWPKSGVSTRRVELYRLPVGAELLGQEGFDVVRERDGRTELLKSVAVTAGGSVRTAFRYRLDGASVPFVGPRVAASIPAAGAEGVDPALSELRVTFDANMRDGSWAWVQVDSTKFPKLAGKAHYVDPRTCVLPVALEPNREYVVWVNKGSYDSFRDKEDRPAKPFELRFRTAGR